MGLHTEISCLKVKLGIGLVGEDRLKHVAGHISTWEFIVVLID